MRTRIAFKYSRLRRIFFPFLSLHDVLLYVVLLSTGAGVIFAIGIPFGLTFFLILLAGYIGGVVLGDEHSPATLNTEGSMVDRIEELLRNAGYTKQSDKWIPSYRRFRWPHDHLELKRKNGYLKVTGPYNVLYELQQLLASEDFPLQDE